MATPIQTEIVRSYSRKIQIAQFEPVDFFSSHKEVYNGRLTPKKREEVSERLFEEAKMDVEVEVAKFKKPDLVVRAKVKEYMDNNKLNYIR